MPGGSGQVVVNGSDRRLRRRRPLHGDGRGPPRREPHRGAARAGRAAPGQWRFELGSTASLEPGSLRVVAGNVALVTGDAVVFRLSGRPGERIVFTFRAGN